VVIRSPDGLHAALPDPDQTGRVHIGQTGATKEIELVPHLLLVEGISREQEEISERLEEEAKPADLFLARAIEEQAVRFGYDEHRSTTAGQRLREESSRGLMELVGAVEESDKNAGVDKDLRHGRFLP
jgi:hypothetical protein